MEHLLLLALHSRLQGGHFGVQLAFPLLIATVGSICTIFSAIAVLLLLVLRVVQLLLVDGDLADALLDVDLVALGLAASPAFARPTLNLILHSCATLDSAISALTAAAAAALFVVVVALLIVIRVPAPVFTFVVLLVIISRVFVIGWLIRGVLLLLTTLIIMHTLRDVIIGRGGSRSVPLDPLLHLQLHLTPPLLIDR